MPKIRIWPDPATPPQRESEAESYLRMLLQDLQTLASNPETLVRAYPPVLPAADELANEFEFHLGLSANCVKERLISQDMLDRAHAVDSKLAEMSQRHDPSLWTDEAVATRGDWSEVRQLAREALAAMGYGLEPPPPWQKTFKVSSARE